MFFGAGSRLARVAWENPTRKTIEANLNVRVYQASSATAVPSGKLQPWKKLTVLAGQTVLEAVPLEFPIVRAESRFIAQLLDDRGSVVGTIDCFVYPSDLLKELAALSDGKPLGVLDPDNRLKPSLKKLDVDIEDLEERGLEYFDGRLAVLGPFANKEQMPPTLSQTIERKSQAGMRIVWIVPAPRIHLEPATRFVRHGSGVIAITDSSLVTNLAENPRAQLNLVRLARFTLRPDLLTSSFLKE